MGLCSVVHSPLRCATVVLNIMSSSVCVSSKEAILFKCLHEAPVKLN